MLPGVFLAWVVAICLVLVLVLATCLAAIWLVVRIRDLLDALGIYR